jgi:hypothetical protein
MFKLSLESLDKSNKEIFDVLVITDQTFYDKNFVNFERKNIHFHITKEIHNADQTCFNKLEVFNWNRIDEYENALLLDCDVIINTDLQKIFDKCQNPNKLYAPIEDRSFDNHRRIYFSLGDYTEDDINFFKINNIHTFNAGTYMFKINENNKLHFNNIKRIIVGHNGDYFSDQSFMNFYFNKMKLVDYDVLNSEDNLIYVVQENFYTLQNLTNKIFHFIGNTYNGENKIQQMKVFFNKIFFDKKEENQIDLNKNVIHIHKVTDDRKNILFKSDSTIRCHASVIAENSTIYERTFDLLKDQTYWISLNEGFLNKKIQFINENFYQEFILHGKSEFLNLSLSYYDLKYKYSEFSNYYKKRYKDEYLRRRKYLDYYYELFVNNNHKKNNILEIESESVESSQFWKNLLPNSKYISTSSELFKVNSNEEDEIYYFDETFSKSLKTLFENKNLLIDFDLIILKKIETLIERNYLKDFINKLSLGGSLIVESVNLEKIEEFESIKKKIENFENKFCSEIICLDERYMKGGEIILKITKKYENR